jgi:hypothetical protein
MSKHLPRFMKMAVALREWIKDMEDLLKLREAKRAEGNAPGRPLEEVAKELGL